VGGQAVITRCWLIRHGEPESEARGRCYGALDIPLSEHGRSQMVQVACHLATEPIAAIYSSPQRRATESAHLIAQPHASFCEIVPDLREINFGDLEGLTYDEIATRYPDVYRQWMDAPTEVQFPNGESFPEMCIRVRLAFAGIQQRNEGRTFAIVTHGGVIRIVIAQALQMPEECVFRLAQDYAAMNLLAWMDDYPSLQLLNCSVEESGVANLPTLPTALMQELPRP
jgi:alpha-ribazole phosphatase